jgi:DNA-binding GntR family transcriptional regulator
MLKYNQPPMQKTIASAYTPLQNDVARQIAEHIGRHGLRAGTRLTELGLAARLRVSRTPIRGALRLLAERGVVAPRGARGVAVAMEPAAVARVRFERRDDTALYERIVQDRADGRLGAWLSEREAMERYGAKRATLLRAIERMAQEGLLRRRRGRGWEFEPGLESTDSERESYRFRLVIECAALLEPGFRLDARHVAECRARHQALLAGSKKRTWAEIFDTNAHFHEMLATASGNRFFVGAMREQNRLRRLSDLADYPRIKVERLRQSCREHLAILDALERGDRHHAAQLMRAHLMSALQTVEQRAAGALG